MRYFYLRSLLILFVFKGIQTVVLSRIVQESFTLKWIVLVAKCRRACDLCFVLIILDTTEMALVSLQINGNMFIRFLHVPPETKACLCIILLDVVVYSLKID